MRLDRGMAFFCILLLSIVILTTALAAAVYKETPAEDRAPYDNSSNLAGTNPTPVLGTGNNNYVGDKEERGDEPGEMGDSIP